MKTLPAAAAPRTIVCLSHLAWESGLFQRPQHLMTCFAQAGHRVLYLGCAGHAAQKRALKAGTFSEGSGEFINVSYSPFTKTAETVRRHLLARQIRKQIANSSNVTLWVTHPALYPLLSSLSLGDTPIVFDSMDPFTHFERSSNDDIIHSMWLCKAAVAVFTGGRTMHEKLTDTFKALRRSTRKVHCFPSGVDWAHFAHAASPELAISPLVANLPKPVWGYFGAVDERVDADLARILCVANPQGSVVLAGPILHHPLRDGETMPNLHTPGAVPYAELPALLKGFDVCLLPFAQTDLVAQISPTKTPEYLAGGKPVVSVAIPDVETTWGDLVAVAASHDEFVVACHAAKPLTSEQCDIARHRASSWQQIADEMLAVLNGK